MSGYNTKTKDTNKVYDEEYKRRKTADGYIIAVLLLIMTLAADAVLIHTEYRNYREKISIITRMSGADEKELFDTAVSLLKGEESKQEEGEAAKQLEAYGYFLDYEDYYYREYKKHRNVIFAGSAGIYAVLFGMVMLLQKQEQNRQKKQLKELECIITEFRKGNYRCPGGHVTGVWLELEALGNTIEVLQTKMLDEKEGIKALVTDISHQLKTPVAALKTCFEMMCQEGLSKEEREEFRDRCSQQLKGLEELLSALIQISRLETGMIEIEKEPVRIFDTMAEAVNRVYVAADKKGIAMELEAEPEIEVMEVLHDKKWLCEAFVNVLENAVKYSPSESTITIRMMRRSSYIRIEIEDEGIGIAKEERNRIFRRFYRGQSESVKREEGSGVGLYLAREIIGNHGGTIAVGGPKREESKKSGSVFVIQLFNT